MSDLFLFLFIATGGISVSHLALLRKCITFPQLLWKRKSNHVGRNTISEGNRIAKEYKKHNQICWRANVAGELHSTKVLSSHFFNWHIFQSNQKKRSMLFIYCCVLVSHWPGKKNKNIIQLKSFWRDQKCEPIKIFVSRMRVALEMFYWMNITNKLLI